MLLGWTKIRSPVGAGILKAGAARLMREIVRRGAEIPTRSLCASHTFKLGNGRLVKVLFVEVRWGSSDNSSNRWIPSVFRQSSHRILGVYFPRTMLSTTPPLQFRFFGLTLLALFRPYTPQIVCNLKTDLRAWPLNNRDQKLYAFVWICILT